MRDDPAAFLEARLNEEELAARMFSGDPCWSTEMLHRLYQRTDDPVLAHAARYDPARALREVAAKRAILAEYNERYYEGRGYQSGLEFAVNALAAVYDDHPDKDGAATRPQPT